MARGAQSDALRQAFETHREETEGQVERLQQVFEIIGKRAAWPRPARQSTASSRKARRCSMSYKGNPALDAGLVAAAQAVEHYEIARYGTLRTWAELLGMKEAVKLLDATLRQETAADEKLSQLADTEANARAIAA